MTYARVIPVEFNHCDPAGIVFYPRYFEMTNSVVENFFREDLGYSFARLHGEGRAVPTVRVAIDFSAPSRLGESLGFSLNVAALGRTSVTFRITAACAGQTRLAGDFTLVWLAPGGRPEPWPATLRTPLSRHLEAQG